MGAANVIQGMHQVALTTSDLDKAAEFYGNTIGLPIIARFDPPGLAFFRVGDVRLSIQQSTESTAASSVIYFSVADIDSATELLKGNGIEFERDPELVFADEAGQFGEAGEEEWMAFFRDPDGNLLALVSRRKN